MKIRLSHRIMFIMGVPIPGKTGLILRRCHCNVSDYFTFMTLLVTSFIGDRIDMRNGRTTNTNDYQPPGNAARETESQYQSRFRNKVRTDRGYHESFAWYDKCRARNRNEGKHRADSSFAPSQWETSLQSNAVSHWLGANLESALQHKKRKNKRTHECFKKCFKDLLKRCWKHLLSKSF